MNRTTKILAGAALVLALGTAAARTATASDSTTRPTVTMHAQWDFRPANVADARARAQQIVLADVVAVRAGEDIAVPAAGEPDGVSRVPTQRVTVRVVTAYKGSARAGDRLTLFQTGGVVSTAKAGDTHPRMVLDGDPFYAKGERYLLMLVPGPQDTLRIVAPEGRFRADQNGALTATATGPVASELNGKRLADLESTLRD